MTQPRMVFEALQIKVLESMNLEILGKSGEVISRWSVPAGELFTFSDMTLMGNEFTIRSVSLEDPMQSYLDWLEEGWAVPEDVDWNEYDD